MDAVNNRWPGSDTVAADPRNVIDYYKYWSTEAIKADLDRKRSQLVVVLENFASDFNLASAVRNANAFVAGRVIIVGRRSWDKRGATGTHHYEHVSYAATAAEALSPLRAEGYRLAVVDNLIESEAISDYAFPEKTCLVFGQESIGVSQDAIELADDVVYIPQYGSTRSLNVGVASGIAMYEYMRRFGVAEAPKPSEV